MVKGKAQSKLKSFEDVLPSADREGEKVEFVSLFGKEIQINGFEVRNSKFHDGNYAIVDIRYNKTDMWFTTGSQVVIDQLELAKDKLPLIAKPRQEGKYYTLR